MKHLIAIAIVLLLTSFSALGQETQPFIKNVSGQTFKELVDAGKGIILDVRTPQEIE